MLYAIFHIYEEDVDCKVKEFRGIIECTEEELRQYLEKWNKPRIYKLELRHHAVQAEPVKICGPEEFVPYSDPEKKDWPDLPRNMYPWATWDGSRWHDDSASMFIWNDAIELPF